MFRILIIILILLPTISNADQGLKISCLNMKSILGKKYEPLKFTLGQGKLIPGFETGILDMAVNDKKIIFIPSDQAYGQRQDEMMHEVKKSQLPQEIKPEVGMPLSSQGPDGQEMHFIITEIKEESIIVDGNHPLAGKDLTFEIEVLSIV